MKGYYFCRALTDDAKSAIRTGMYYRVWAAPVHGSNDTAFLVETPKGDVHIGSKEIFFRNFKVVET